MTIEERFKKQILIPTLMVGTRRSCLAQDDILQRISQFSISCKLARVLYFDYLPDTINTIIRWQAGAQ